MNKIKYLTQSEIKRLFRVVNKEGSIRDIAIFQLTYYLGLRASEVGALKWEDWNEAAGEIYVRRLKGSSSGTRRLDIKRTNLLKELKEETQNFSLDKEIFTSRLNQGIKRGMLHFMMKKYGLKAHIPQPKQHFHTLRHSIAVHMAEAGLDIKEVQWILGHKDIKTTLVYFEFTTRQQEPLYSKLKDAEGIII